MSSLRQTTARQASSKFTRLPQAKHPEVRKGLDAVKQLIARRDYRNAGDLINRMMAIEPRNAELHFLAAIASESAGLKQQAIAAYRKVVELAPNFLPALVNGAATLADDLRPLEALQLYRKAMIIAPTEPAVRNNIAKTLADLRRREEVIQHRSWLARKGNATTQDITALAEAYDLAGRTDEARRTFNQALQRKDAEATVHVLTAMMEMTRGNTEAASAEVNKALAIAADDGHARLLQAKLSAKTLDLAAEIDFIKMCLPAEDGRPYMHRAALYSAYALLNQAAGNIDEAFKAFSQSARIANINPEMDAQREFAISEQAKALSAHIAAHPDQLGSDSEKPVFVTGMPRSGTTLIEQILSSHSQADGAGELELVQYLINSLNPLGKQRISDAAQAYLDADVVKKSKARRVIDKSLSTWENIGAILAMFPNARIIDCQRHPMDVCWSAYTELFADNALIYTYDFARLASAYKRHEELIRFWMDKKPENIIRVRYEDVIADPEAQARRLISHIGLDWEDACLDFMNSTNEVRTASALQVRQPIYSTSVGKWRRYETHLQPLADLLKDEIAGYESGKA